MEDLERLLAFEDLRLLRARYWRYVDLQQWDAFASLFTDDCVFEARSDAFVSPPGGRAIAEAVAGVLVGAKSIHHGFQHELELLDRDHAKGIWTMADYLLFPPGASHADAAAPTAFVRGFGYYVDEYLREDGTWRFSRVELYRTHLEIMSHSSSEIPEVLTK